LTAREVTELTLSKLLHPGCLVRFPGVGALYRNPLLPTTRFWDKMWKMSRVRLFWNRMTCGK